MAPGLVCDASGVRARAPIARRDAPLRSLHSQQWLVGTCRDLPRSDPRSARPARMAPGACAEIHELMVQALVAREAMTARRCSNTIAGLETENTRRFKRDLPRTRPAPRWRFESRCLF
jgi:hypothetical protein